MLQPGTKETEVPFHPFFRHRSNLSAILFMCEKKRWSITSADRRYQDIQISWIGKYFSSVYFKIFTSNVGVICNSYCPKVNVIFYLKSSLLCLFIGIFVFFILIDFIVNAMIMSDPPPKKNRHDTHNRKPIWLGSEYVQQETARLV